MLLVRIFTLVIVVALVGCTDRRQPNVEFVQDMMIDPAIKAQDFDHDRADKRANLLPPEGTIPRHWTPYPNFLNDQQAKDYKNPLADVKGQEAQNIILKGQQVYQVFCAVCHGAQGYGEGTVVDKMIVKPPHLMNEKIRSWTDGQLFHLITKGRGLMGGYEAQIPSYEDRWALVNYIRYLQKNQKEESPNN